MKIKYLRSAFLLWFQNVLSVCFFWNYKEQSTFLINFAIFSVENFLSWNTDNLYK